MSTTSFRTRIRAVAMLGSALTAGTSVAAAAQTASNPEVQATDEIVVTAERRATNLQSTPLSILAVTQETVQAKGIKDLADLSRFTPNLSITPTRGGGSAAANFVIRGISGGGGATGERGVGLYIDGIYMPRTSGAVLRVLDIDRIEVLRGPQGTLFGRNSTGGAIRIFSKQPSDKFSGSLELNGGNFGHYDVIGMLNVPLGEGFALRAQGAYLKEDGYVSRGTQMLGEHRDIIGRVQLRGDLTSNFKATVGFMYNDSKQNATPWVFQEFDMRPGVNGVLNGNYSGWLNDAFKGAGQAPLAAYNDSRLVKGPYAAPDICLIEDFNPDYDSACDQYNNDKYWQADLNLDWKISDAVSVHSISGYSTLKHRAVTDFELIGMEMRYEVLNSKVFYQELQLNAALFGGAVDLVTGGSYFHEKSDSPYNYVLNRRGTAVGSIPGAGSPSALGIPPNADGGLYTRTISDVFQTSDSWGIFASGTWHIADGLNLTGGIRQAWDHKDYRQNRYEPPATATQAADFKVTPGTTMSSASKSQPFHALDYRVTIDYHLDKDIMAYATISKAYKAGAFSATLQSGGGAVQDSIVATIPNEKVINYEGGFRTTLFDRHLRFNPTVFVMHYTDRQAAIRVNCGTGVLASLTPGGPGCPVGFLPLLQDQGDAWIRGFELDAQAVLGGGFMLDGSLGSTAYTLHNAPPGTTHLFPDIPGKTYNLGLTYVTDASVGRATFNFNYAYVGKQSVYPDDSADSGYILPAYGLVNARLQLKTARVPLTISLYANNLLDEVYASYAQRFGAGFWGSYPGVGVTKPAPRNALSVVRGRPREFGASIKYEF